MATATVVGAVQDENPTVAALFAPVADNAAQEIQPATPAVTLTGTYP